MVGPNKIAFHPNSRRELLDMDVFSTVESEVQIHEFKLYRGCCVRVCFYVCV